MRYPTRAVQISFTAAALRRAYLHELEKTYIYQTNDFQTLTSTLEHTRLHNT